jgi:hypothetical protein
MTIDQAIQRLEELRAEAGTGELILEVKQLNGMNRTVNSMHVVNRDFPELHCLLILLNDEPVHG